MPQFTLSQLLMGMALIAIILAFTQSEGCGQRRTVIESLSFSSDDSRIAVTKLDARDANTPNKGHKANVARTVSWLGVADGSHRGIIHQDFKRGNRGPAWEFWRLGRTSALCNPSNDHVAMLAFGGGDVTCNVDTAQASKVSLTAPALNIAFSRSGRFFAASGHDEVTVVDTKEGTVRMHVQSNGQPFVDGSLMAFTSDESRIVLVGYSGVHVWHIPTSTQRFTVIQELEVPLNAIAVTPDDQVIVCSDKWVRRYDFQGRIVATLADKGAYACSIARDGNRLAVCTRGDLHHHYYDGDLRIYDLNSNRMLRSWSGQSAAAVALSSAGEEIAVGDFHGRVALFDTATGERRWYSTPPGRYRWPWTLPAAVFVAWAYVARRLSRRQTDVDTPIQNAAAEDERRR